MGDEQNIEPTPAANTSAGATGPEPQSGTATGTATDKGAELQAGSKALTPGQRLAAKRGKKAQQKQELKSELKRKEDEDRADEEAEAERVMGVYKPTAAPDPVQEAARDFSGYMHDHRNLIVGGVFALLAVGLVIVLGKNFLTGGSGEQAKLLATAIEISNAAIDATNDEGKNAEGKPVFKSEKDRATKAGEAFAAAAKASPDSSASGWAKLGQGHALMVLGKASEAVPLYAGTFTAQRSQVALAALALEGQALALEAANKNDEALKRLDELKVFDDGAFKDLAEYQIARLKLAAGDREGAKTLLKGVYDRLGSPAEGAPKSRFLKGEVEVRLAELDSSLVPAGGGGGQEFSPEEIQRLIQQLQQQKGGAPAGAE